MNNSKSNTPTHRIYAVTRGKNKKNYWHEIGACWAHEDGEGFSLALDYLPLNGADLVIRKPKPKDEPEAEANPAEAE